MKPDKTSEQIRAELELAEAEAKNLNAEIEQISELLECKKDRLKTLVGTHWKNGLISILKSQLIEATRYEADLVLPHPVFVEDFERGQEYVISRVTPKFIWIRQIGSKYEEKYNRKTGESAYISRLDADATLEAWNDYAKNR